MACQPGEVGVLLVHGIGVQEEGDLRDSLGGAIARLWAEFDDPEHRWSSHTCPSGHLHLDGPDGTVATIDEGHWDDVLESPPAPRKIMAFLLTAAPLMVLITMVRPPRLRGEALRAVRGVGWWIIRLAFAMVTVLAVECILLVVGLLTILTHRLGAFRAVLRVLALTVGDLHGFARDREMSRRFVERVVHRARTAAEGRSRLVVVAHSQGGAITFEAVRHPEWPSVPTHVVTLGSGHKRLTVLRWLRARPGRRLIEPALWLLAFSIIGAGVSQRNRTAAASGLTGAELQGDALGRSAAQGLVFAMIALLGFYLSGRAIRRSILSSTASWRDIWATRDLVPDGPACGGFGDVEVANRMSFILDHTTYHENAPQVIAPIVDAIHPPRLAGKDHLRSQLVRERNRRVRGSQWWYLVGFRPPRNRLKAPAASVLGREFAGRARQDADGFSTDSPSVAGTPPP